MDHRSEKLISLIRSEAAVFLKTCAETPPGTLLTVTRVELSSDQQYADVFISIFPAQRVGAFLEKFRRWQREFNMRARKELRVRRVPVIRFKLDETELKSERIQELLKDKGK